MECYTAYLRKREWSYYTAYLRKREWSYYTARLLSGNETPYALGRERKTLERYDTQVLRNDRATGSEMRDEES